MRENSKVTVIGWLLCEIVSPIMYTQYINVASIV